MSEKIISKWTSFEGIEYELFQKDYSFKVRTLAMPHAEAHELCQRIEFLEKALEETGSRRARMYNEKAVKP